jgi:hypothetical protein
MKGALVAKKKKKKPVPQRNAVMEALGAIDGGSRVSTRVNSVIEKMTRPPETIVEHLRRVGVDFSVVPHPDDGSPWLVCDFAQMTAKELQSIQEGGYFKNEYPAKKDGPAIGKRPAGADMIEGLRKAFESRKGQETQSFPLYPTEKQLADLRRKLQGEPDTSKRLLVDPAVNNAIERVTKLEHPKVDLKTFASPCVCGSPSFKGIVHRQDGPCYHLPGSDEDEYPTSEVRG